MKKRKEIDTSKMHDIEAYTHDDKKRANNPPVGMAHRDVAEEKRKVYAFDPHIDPTLDWAGKKEGLSFDVTTSSIHIHESIKPATIISSVHAINKEGHVEDDGQINFFSQIGMESAEERMRRKLTAIEFYKHGVDWTNRLIAGDSLVIMNSMLEKEGMAGQVQMVYIDPPYGIKYGSNFQPFIDKRDVKDKKDEDLTAEPEMITAFRDTWELGIHSYLTYLRNRLLLARELLHESGSVFIQISDENLHLIRNLCDELFGVENFVSQIIFRKKQMPLGALHLETTCDFIIWYAKNKSHLKFKQLYKNKDVQGDNHWNMIQLSDGTSRKMTADEISDHALLPKYARIFRLLPLYPAGFNDNALFGVDYQGKKIFPPKGKSWKTSESGMKKLIQENRVTQYDSGDTLQYIAYLDDYNVSPIMDLWTDTAPPSTKIYAVQTAILPIQRCILMSTDPGDLVLDITCGSGTTAYVAEQWGRRWITCDTSRIAITLAKKRLMTATYDYYKLAYEAQGVGSGFIYKTVPHITLGSIANNEPPPTETLCDQPEIDKTKIRVSGPFTVEALPAPVVKPLDDISDLPGATTTKQADWRDELLATGILGRGGAKIEFSRVENLSGTKFLHAEAETKEDTPRRAVICFAGETKPMDSRMVMQALDEAENLRPTPKLIIFAAFQFDPEAAKRIDEQSWPGVTLLKVQMNTDLMTEDLKKKRSSNQSFWLVGQPDVELVQIDKGKDKGKYKVIVRGFDYYDVKTGEVVSGNANRIAMWMLDSDYDGMAPEPKQVFFPMSGGDGWGKLAKTLKAEIDQDLIEKFAGTESIPFAVKANTLIAIKIIDDRGIESMKVLKVGG